VAGEKHENDQQNQNGHCNGDTGAGGDAGWDPAPALALIISLWSSDASTLEELPRHFFGRYHAP
jgi:hypothetical protein